MVVLVIGVAETRGVLFTSTWYVAGAVVVIVNCVVPLVAVLGLVLIVPENTADACPVTVTVVDHNRVLLKVSITLNVYTPG